MLKMLNGKSFSMGLVQEILSYSMPVPKILDQLDLWEHVGDWMATMCGGPAFVHQRQVATQLMLKTLKECRTMAKQRAMAKQAHTPLHWGTCFVVDCLLLRIKIASGKHSQEPYFDLLWHGLSNKVNDPFRTALERVMQHAHFHWKRNMEKCFRNNRTTNFNQQKYSPIHRSTSKFLYISLVFQPNPPMFYPRDATSGDAIEPDVKATEDLMTALRASRDQVPALNVDGVCLCLWFWRVFDRLLSVWLSQLFFWRTWGNPSLTLLYKKFENQFCHRTFLIKCLIQALMWFRVGGWDLYAGNYHLFIGVPSVIFSDVFWL